MLYTMANVNYIQIKSVEYILIIITKPVDFAS